VSPHRAQPPETEVPPDVALALPELADGELPLLKPLEVELELDFELLDFELEVRDVLASA
jgi:hypothetical protein